MYEFLTENYTTILIVAIAVVIALLVLCIIAKLFKIAIGLAILCIVVPTVFWGDGSEYVSKFASFFQPAYKQQIEDAYEYYKRKDSEDPFVDYDAVSNAVTDIFQKRR